MLADLAFAVVVIGAAYGLWRLARPRMEKIEPAAWRWFCIVIFVGVPAGVLEGVYQQALSGEGVLNGYIGIGIAAAFLADECYAYAMGLTGNADVAASADEPDGDGVRIENKETSGEGCYE